MLWFLLILTVTDIIPYIMLAIKDKGHMKLEIDTNDFLNNGRDRVFLGEFLRSKFFNQTNGLGCYSSFILNENVVELPDEDFNGLLWSENPKGMKGEDIYHCAVWNGIKMRYYWDGDGYLEFIIDDNTRIYNDDCKKTDRWYLT